MEQLANISPQMQWYIKILKDILKNILKIIRKHKSFSL